MNTQTVINTLSRRERLILLAGIGALGIKTRQDLHNRMIQAGILGNKLYESCGHDAIESMKHLGQLYAHEIGVRIDI